MATQYCFDLYAISTVLLNPVKEDYTSSRGLFSQLRIHHRHFIAKLLRLVARFKPNAKENAVTKKLKNLFWPWSSILNVLYVQIIFHRPMIRAALRRKRANPVPSRRKNWIQGLCSWGLNVCFWSSSFILEYPDWNDSGRGANQLVRQLQNIFKK